MATLYISREDRRLAYVSHNGSSCWLGQLLEAATQSDADLARAYRDILAEVAKSLTLRIRKRIDGSRYRGCWWYDAELSVDGEVVANWHNPTGNSFRGWYPTDEQTRDETTAVLRRAVQIGLGTADCDMAPTYHTVAAWLAARLSR